MPKTPAVRARDAQVAFYAYLLAAKKDCDAFRAELESVFATAEAAHHTAGIKKLTSHRSFSNRHPEFFKALEARLWRLVEIGASPMATYEKMAEALYEQGFAPLYMQTAAREAVQMLEA